MEIESSREGHLDTVIASTGFLLKKPSAGHLGRVHADGGQGAEEHRLIGRNDGLAEIGFQSFDNLDTAHVGARQHDGFHIQLLFSGELGWRDVSQSRIWPFGLSFHLDLVLPERCPGVVHLADKTGPQPCQCAKVAARGRQ